MTKLKAYVQFSKRIVLLVTIAVTVISAAGAGAVLLPKATRKRWSVRFGRTSNYATIVFCSVQRQLGVREVADAGEER